MLILELKITNTYERSLKDGLNVAKF